MSSTALWHHVMRPTLTPVLLLALAVGTAMPRPATAAKESNALVEKATLTIEKLLVDPNLSELGPFIRRARGVLIIPQLVKGGFIIGGEGGTGVLLVKGADNSWSSPAFFTLAAGSIGLQIGGQVSEVVFTLMNDGAVNAVLEDSFKLGADASIAIGPIGKGIEASTTTHLKDDIYAFSRAVGLFGGGALEGAAILKRKGLNDEYYGAVTDSRSILIERKFYNGHADRLRSALPQ